MAAFGDVKYFIKRTGNHYSHIYSHIQSGVRFPGHTQTESVMSLLNTCKRSHL